MNSIIFVTGAMSRGGAERVISLLSKEYADMGWQVRIVMLLHNRVEYTLHPDVEVINLSDERKNVLRLVYKLRCYIKKNRPDVVVSFMAPICAIAGLACYRQKVRLVLSERIDPAAENRNPAFEALLNILYAKSQVTVMQTKRAMNYFSKAVQRNSVIIPNPISVSEYASMEKRKRIVSVGRLMPQKNQAMLIDAFSTFYKSHSDYVLDIYGEGPLEESLCKQIERLGLSDAVTLRGNVPNIHEHISDAEAFVLSSDYEGMSNALLEAMMMGLACISTNCAGSDEVIVDGENGLLIPVGDTEGLTYAMMRLIEDKGLRNNIEGNARKVSERYSTEKVLVKWRKAIEGVTLQK